MPLDLHYQINILNLHSDQGDMVNEPTLEEISIFLYIHNSLEYQAVNKLLW